MIGSGDDNLSFRIGDRIAGYQVIGMLGVGGMGAVYQVKHLISERVEALKVLLPDMVATPDIAERFVREIRLQASLDHPNIASLHTALEVDNQLLMIMEFIDGQTLAEMLRSTSLMLPQALSIGIQVLSALDYAHSRGVVHRDVKPSNVMIDKSGIVRLMDFGIARAAHEMRHLTQAGAAIGSVFYMSPEQVRGEEADGRSDIYGAGVMLFEVLTGELPFKGRTSTDVMKSHLSAPPVWPGNLNPSISGDLSRVLLKALEKDRLDRYQTAGEFRHELLRVSGTPQAGYMPSPEVRTPRTPGGTALPTNALPRPSKRESASSGTPSSGSQPRIFDPHELDRISKELAQHIGPFAKELVKRAAKKATNWQELYAELAPEVPAGKLRERFLAGRPRP
jgi:eukaryotic-like serine/threonine-protein kinase